jgi:outer membrane protein assembly factor BamB
MRLPLLLCTLVFAGGAAADWPQWRGPARDGRAQFQAPATWPARLTRKWRVAVGEGHSSPLIVGGAAYVFSRQGDQEVARRLDLATGREVWKTVYAAPYEMNPAATGHGKGPKSTPLHADGRLYTFGITGVLSCLDGGTGKVIWRRAGTGSPLYGTAASPILEGGLLIAHVGGHDAGPRTARATQRPSC